MSDQIKQLLVSAVFIVGGVLVTTAAPWIIAIIQLNVWLVPVFAVLALLAIHSHEQKGKAR